MKKLILAFSMVLLCTFVSVAQQQSRTTIISPYGSVELQTFSYPELNYNTIYVWDYPSTTVQQLHTQWYPNTTVQPVYKPQPVYHNCNNSYTPPSTSGVYDYINNYKLPF